MFYVFVSWCAVAAYPTEADMVAKAFSDGVNFFLTPIQSFVGGWAYELMFFLILTSSFACGMAFHNTASRYMYSLGRDGVLPKMVAETHDHHKSPHKASAVQSVLAAVWVLLYGFSYGFDDPSGQAWLGVYTLFAVLGTGLLLVLQAVVSLAIFVWFKNNGGGNVLTTVVAPLISLDRATGARLHAGRQSRDAGRHQRFCQEHPLRGAGDPCRRPGLGFHAEVGKPEGLRRTSVTW